MVSVRGSCGLALILSSFAVTSSAADDNTQVISFLRQYCFECHADGAAEGERDFGAFGLPVNSVQQVITADEIIDQVTLRQMPPEDSKQPTDEQRVALVKLLRSEIQKAKDTVEGSTERTVFRRLSHREYENTLATLFGRRVDTLGLTADFPRQATSQHLENIGESMVTSGFLLDQYFQSASRLVEARLGSPVMKPRAWHFTDNFRQYEELSGAHSSVFNYEYLCLYEQPDTDTRQGGYGHIEDFLEGVPVSGLYDIEVHVQAMHRDTHYDPKIFRIDFSEPFQIGVVPGDATKGHIHYPQSIEPILATAVVPDDKPEWLSFRVWLEVGQTPRFIFPNGPYESRASVIEVNRRYKDEFKNGRQGVSRAHILREGKLPHIRIGEVKIDGPVHEQGGSAEELAVFGAAGFQSEGAIEQLFSFGQRAYRRPLNDEDRLRIRTLYERRISEEATSRQAALDTLKMILCSPSFLYLSEITQGDEDQLNEFDLASRLSYTLWAAPPDDELFAAARSGNLSEPRVLRSQIRRMLSDGRSKGFTDGFLDSWLNLRDIGNLPPPRKAAWEYYSTNLPASMKQEARLFFRFLLDNDRAVTELIESDYTFVDKKLARLYQLPCKEEMRLADGFKKVSLTESDRRGGVLGMAGVLTVSANGVETSPVTRGVWILENMLGMKQPPPPDEVPAIDADVSGAKSIREKLERHSADKTCQVCHRKIDPPGYALESFDPIGRWRKNYPKVKGQKTASEIDSTGTLTSGESFSDFRSFKKVLLARRSEAFARNLIVKILSYSTGRHMSATDRFEIDNIQASVEANGGGLRTMVEESLMSRIFRSR